LGRQAQELKTQAQALKAKTKLAERKEKEAREEKLKADAATEKALLAANEAERQRDEAVKERQRANEIADEATKQTGRAEARATELKQLNDQLAVYKNAAESCAGASSGERGGSLKLDLRDVGNKLLEQTVTVKLRNISGGDTRTVQIDPARGGVITGLHTAPRGTYSVRVDALSFFPVTQFVNVKSGGVTEAKFTLPINPENVTRVQFPTYAELPNDAKPLLGNSANAFGFEGKTGESLYNALALDPIRMASLFNLMAKARTTRFADGRSALSFIAEIKVLRGDRFFVAVDRELHEEVKNGVPSGLFHAVSGLLHHLPPQFEGFDIVDSFKTADHFGNLQITFFRKGNEFVADIDIDDGGGITDLFHVERNPFTAGPTHPYNIHEILVSHGIDPGYTLIP
jgi:hypothetical protein